MNQDYYFPLFGLFATAGKIFSAFRRWRGNNRTRLIRKNTLDSGEEDFLRVICGSMPALAGLEPPVTFAENSVP